MIPLYELTSEQVQKGLSKVEKLNKHRSFDFPIFEFLSYNLEDAYDDSSLLPKTGIGLFYEKIQFTPYIFKLKGWYKHIDKPALHKSYQKYTSLKISCILFKKVYTVYIRISKVKREKF